MVPEGAWYATDFYPRSLKAWITLRGRLDSPALQHVVSNILSGCLAMQKSRGYSHGNLKASNLFLVGKPQALRTTPIHLADACAAELFQRPQSKGAPSGAPEKDTAEAVELQDLRSTGELILQLVEGRLISSGYDYNYPIARSAPWDNLGKDGERWREICNQLLDPQLSLDKINLAMLETRIRETSRPNPVVANLRAILAATGAVVLIAVGVFLGVREKVPKILAQPQNTTIEVRSNLTLTATAAGRKLKYQWWKDGNGIASMAGPTLEIASVQTNDSGAYYLVVSNWAGAITSRVVQVMVATTLLKVSPHNQSRSYGEQNPPLTGDVAGLRAGDDIAISYRSPAQVNSPVGAYDIIPVFMDPGGNLRNYLVSTNPAKLTVVTAPLTVRAHDAKRGYGDPDPPLNGETQGLIPGDNISVTYSSSAKTDSPAGNYDIMPVFNDPDGRLQNYALILTKGILAIGRAPLTVTVHDQQRVYGDSDPVLNGDVVGVRLNDNLTASYHSAAGSNSPVGDYNILPAFNDPAGKLRNYNVTTNKGTLTVRRAPLIVTVHSPERVYGENNPPLTGEITGLRAGDDITASYNTKARNDTVVGVYDIFPEFKDAGRRLNNYNVSTNQGRLTINNAPLKVVAHDAKRVYGDNNPNMTGDLSGQRPGDNISASFDTPARSNSVVGVYDITPLINDPDRRLYNYTITTNTGTLTVTQASLTVSAHDNKRSYGENNPSLTGDVVGLRAGDEVTAVFETLARNDTPVGAYDIFPMFVDSGSRLRNYNIVTNKGALKITLTRLSVAANNSTRPYGENNPPFIGEVGGLRPGDGIKVAFDTAARSDTVIGTYDIIPLLKDPANRLHNYDVVTNRGTLTITTARLTVLIHDQKRPYGKNNPDFTGEVKGLRTGVKSLFGTPVRGDDVAVSYRVSADASSPAGNYKIIPIFNDPDNKLDNYNIVTNLGTLMIGTARLTVTAKDQKRAQGEKNPPLTGDVSGLRPGDNIAVAFVTTADDASAAGNYPIVPVFEDPANKLSNYTVITNKGSLTITSSHR